MNTDGVVRIVRDGLLLVLVLSAGPLAVATLTGLIVSLLQATTQMQEATLSFVPKLAAVAFALVFLGPWMLHEIVRFAQLMFAYIVKIP